MDLNIRNEDEGQHFILYSQRYSRTPHIYTLDGPSQNYRMMPSSKRSILISSTSQTLFQPATSPSHPLHDHFSASITSATKSTSTINVTQLHPSPHRHFSSGTSYLPQRPPFIQIADTARNFLPLITQQKAKRPRVHWVRRCIQHPTAMHVSVHHHSGITYYVSQTTFELRQFLGDERSASPPKG